MDVNQRPYILQRVLEQSAWAHNLGFLWNVVVVLLVVLLHEMTLL